MMVTASWRLLAMTVPWLRRSLVADIPPQRTGFSLVVIHEGYAVDEEARGQFFLPSLRLSDGPILLSYLLSEKGPTDPSEAAGPRDYRPTQDISSPITDLDRPRGFQEVKVPRFRDNGTGWW